MYVGLDEHAHNGRVQEGAHAHMGVAGKPWACVCTRPLHTPIMGVVGVFFFGMGV